MDFGLVHVIVVLVLCFVLIAFRCGYRLFFHCRIHASCHRTWHQDDIWMALAVLALAGRSTCVVLYNNLTRPEDASVADHQLALKLLIPSRLCYALVEWCMKLCIVSFYFRLPNGTLYMKFAPRFAFAFICLTYLGVVLATLLECRPLSLAWAYSPSSDFVEPKCQESLANLLTMAISNIVTDIMIILLPIPALSSMSMSGSKKLQVILLFSMGIFVIAVTIARLPLIIDHGITQRLRSLWASIEIAVSCIVANFIFYYVLIKDIREGHGNARIRECYGNGYSAGSAARGHSSFESTPSIRGLCEPDKDKVNTYQLEHFEA